MKGNKTIFCVFMLNAFLLFGSIIAQQQTVVFNTNNLSVGVIETGAGSLNINWLLDSDIERPRNTSNEARFAEMGIGSLRYPYGHLANNYLWDTPPYGGVLEPKVATLNQIPGSWTWSTNPDRTMNKIMDFDEFMEICQRQNIKPLVVINIMSYKYTNGPSYQELKTTAVEWVKYAKNKGYNVAYWQIGNEQDHHTDLMTKLEYIALYQDFVGAMKTEDSSITCGTGILSNISFLTDLLAQSPDLVDFTSVHQYLFNVPFTDYNQWLNHNGSSLNSNVSNMQNAVNNSSKPNLPILITESNAFGNWSDEWPALYKGLAWFDMLFTQQQYEDVKYTYMWNSHSPWNGENGDGGIANALFNDMDNNLTAMGWSVKLLNTTAEERFMTADNKVHGPTYSYGSYTPGTGDMTIYLINKSASTVPMNVNVSNYSMSTAYEKWLLSGNDQYDANPTFTQTGTITLTTDGFTTDLPPYSLVVVKLKESPPIYYFIDNVGSNKRMKSNDIDTDVEPVSTTDLGWKGKWELVDAGDGYTYVQNQANNMRLQGTSSIIDDEKAVKLVDSSSSGDWVKWKLTQIGTNWFIDNKAHDRRLNINGNNEVSVGLTSLVGLWMQWKLTDVTISSAKVATKNEILTLNTTEKFDTLIYPNPIKAGTNLWLQYIPNLDEDVLEIRIVDPSGSQITTEKINLFKGVNKYKVKTNKLSSGVYFMELISNNHTKTNKKLLIN